MRRLSVADVAMNVAHGVVDVTIGDDQIETAVESEIGKTTAEAESCFGRTANSCGNGNVVELTCGG